ncbi:MAG TPA: hypothetical protein VFS31_11360 [Chitinophagaceae bacterium]|nr:hypothetical protein [Chitinophagaceae bacterium]
MVNVLVTVYKDINGVCLAGYTKSVSGSSTVFAVERVYMDDTPLSCNQNLPAYKDLLKIFDPAYGELWIDETVEGFADLVNIASSATAGGLQAGEFTATATSQTVVIPFTVNKSVDSVFVDGIWTPAANYTFTSSTGTFVFVPAVTIAAGSNILVLYR